MLWIYIMFQWTFIFATIAMVSKFLGMNDATELAALIAVILFAIGSCLYLPSILGSARKTKSRRA